MNIPLKFPSIFKTPTYKKFEYNPLYFDKQKDEQKKNSIRSEQINGLNGKQHAIRFYSKFSNKYRGMHGQSKNVLISQLRVVAIILFLLAVVWYLLH